MRQSQKFPEHFRKVRNGVHDNPHSPWPDHFAFGLFCQAWLWHALLAPWQRPAPAASRLINSVPRCSGIMQVLDLAFNEP